MADTKISSLSITPAIANNNLVPYSTGTATRAVQVNSASSTNTIVIRDGSGNVGVNGLTANTFTGGTFSGTTFTGGTFNGTFVGDGSGLTNLPSSGGATVTGTILMYGGATAPTGYLLCDGARYSRTGFANLFAVIGTSYGAPDSTTFYVPDLRGRVPVGAGTGTGLTARSRGQTFGVESVSLNVNNLPNHQHKIIPSGYVIAGPGANRFVIGGTWDGRTVNSYSNLDGGYMISGGTATPFTTVPPSAVVNYIIKT